MTKRAFLVALIAVLMLTLCSVALADMDFELRPEQKKAMQDAGRETENLLAGKEYWNEDEPEATMILAQAGDTAQLTALERNLDGSWRIAGYNDTIPASIITSAAVTTWSISLEDNQECIFFMLKMEKYIPSTAGAVENVLLAYRSLQFIWTPGRGFMLASALDVPFEDAVEGRCPYHQLTMQEEGWVYKLYEMINKENDQAWYRSEQIVEKAVPEKDLVPYAELSQLDYPAFLTFLHSLTPEEYEHLPVQSFAVTPSSEPEEPEKEDETVYVYYNPQGGRYYHADRLCPAVNSKYWPLSPISFDFICTYSNLLPCVHCNAPERPLLDTQPTEEPLENNAGKSAEEDETAYVYYNFNNGGGRFYHADPECPTVSPDWWPLTPIPFDEINSKAYRNVLPCVICEAPDRPPFDVEPTEEPLKNDAGDSDFRTLEFRYGNNGLTFLRITMNDEEKRMFTCAPLPPFCYLDTYHDGDAILIHHYAEMAQNPDAWDELAAESWFMTFEYVEDDWRLTYISNGQDWMASVENGVYTFDDHYSDGSRWQWSAEFEDRLLVFDYTGMAKLIDRYNAAMPDRPSLHEDELE